MLCKGGSLLVAALLGVACGEPEDRPSKVTDLRVLAVAAFPPEILFDHAAARFDADTVTFEALVVDPQGQTVPARWSFCPIESDDACRDYEATLARVPEPMRPMLDGLRQQRIDGLGAPTVDPARGPAALDVPSFVVGLDPALVAYHLQASALGGGNGAWISAALDAGALTAKKRVLLGVHDLSAYNAELRTRFGFEVCPADPVAAPGCLPLPPKRANRNPTIAEVQLARGALAGQPFSPMPADGPLRLHPREKVRLLPVLAPDAEETYHVIDAAFQGHALEVVERREQAVVSWFATAGTFHDDVTAASVTKTLDNVFTAPDAAAVVSIWAVVRDGRGGTGWRHVAAVVEP